MWHETRRLSLLERLAASIHNVGTQLMFTPVGFGQVETATVGETCSHAVKPDLEPVTGLDRRFDRHRNLYVTGIVTQTVVLARKDHCAWR